MKRMFGYVVSVAGIVIMLIGFNMVRPNWEIFNLIGNDYLSGIGLALVGIGVIISLRGKKWKSGIGSRKSGEDEVPIYEGVGRHRRIVGYRKR